MKVKGERNRVSSSAIRQQMKFYYDNKFFNKWMNKFKFSENLTYQEKHYIMKKFWSNGTIACSRRLNPIEDDRLPKLVFTPWVLADTYNCYDFPNYAMCVNTRGVSYINDKEALEVDKDIVLGWCQANLKGVYSMIECKVNQLVDLEMVIRICTKNQKSPWIIAMSPEDKKAVEQLINDMESDEPILVTMLQDLKNAKALNSTAPYILDKLEAMRQKIEDDIDTQIGESNVGIAQKKEHLTDDEVQSNNVVIQNNDEDFLSYVKDFFSRINMCFGIQYDVELNREEYMDIPNQEEEELDNEDE
jgi:hypothetical protein